MAIAFDAVVSGSSTTSTSKTYSHTCTGSDRMLFVACASAAGDTVTGVTYNGVSMVQIKKQKQGNASQFAYLYALFAPAPGANNVVITCSGSTSIYGTSTSYTGVTQSNTMDATASSQISSGSFSASTNLTTIADNCWTICFCINDVVVFNANSDTMRGTNNGANIFDSNSAITPAGSKTMTQGGASGSANVAVVMASFSPFVSSLFIPKITFL